MTPTGARCPKHRSELTAYERSGWSAAFTLIELLAVVMVILVVASLTLGVAKYVNNRSNISQTRALLAKLELAIESFRSDNGYYPTSSVYRSSSPLFHAEVMNSALLYTQLTGPKNYITFSRTETAETISDLSAGGSTYIVDAWGAPIIYFCPLSNVTYQVSNQTVGYKYDTVPATNFFIAGLDNFSVGSPNTFINYELFSYGPDKLTHVPGAVGTGGGYDAKGWPYAWTYATSTTDDVTASQR